MSDIYAMNITDKGLKLLAKALAKEVVIYFTRVDSGDGYLPEGADPYKIESLVHPVRDLPLHSMDVEGTGVAVIKCVQSNQGLTEEYWCREIGVYATDPDEGEILYSYCNMGDRADFIPAEGGSVAMQYVLALITIISRASKVEAMINGDLTFVTHYELDTRVSKLFGDAAPIFEFWTRTNAEELTLRPVSKEAVMNCFGLQDYAALSRRVDIIENNDIQARMDAELKGIYPDATHWIYENFVDPDQIDTFCCEVVTVVSGSNNIDCDQIIGLVPGCEYVLTDGRRRELISVKSINVENNVRRLVLNAPIQNTYKPGRTVLLRTSATVLATHAEGIRPPRNANWSPNVVWQGLKGNEAFTVGMNVSVSNLSSYNVDGDISISSSAEITLEEVL